MSEIKKNLNIKKSNFIRNPEEKEEKKKENIIDLDEGIEKEMVKDKHLLNKKIKKGTQEQKIREQIQTNKDKLKDQELKIKFNEDVLYDLIRKLHPEFQEKVIKNQKEEDKKNAENFENLKAPKSAPKNATKNTIINNNSYIQNDIKQDNYYQNINYEPLEWFIINKNKIDIKNETNIREELNQYYLNMYNQFKEEIFNSMNLEYKKTVVNLQNEINKWYNEIKNEVQIEVKNKIQMHKKEILNISKEEILNDNRILNIEERLSNYENNLTEINNNINTIQNNMKVVNQKIQEVKINYEEKICNMNNMYVTNNYFNEYKEERKKENVIEQNKQVKYKNELIQSYQENLNTSINYLKNEFKADLINERINNNYNQLFNQINSLNNQIVSNRSEMYNVVNTLRDSLVKALNEQKFDQLKKLIIDTNFLSEDKKNIEALKLNFENRCNNQYKDFDNRINLIQKEISDLNIEKVQKEQKNLKDSLQKIIQNIENKNEENSQLFKNMLKVEQENRNNSINEIVKLVKLNKENSIINVEELLDKNKVIKLIKKELDEFKVHKRVSGRDDLNVNQELDELKKLKQEIEKEVYEIKNKNIEISNYMSEYKFTLKEMKNRNNNFEDFIKNVKNQLIILDNKIDKVNNNNLLNNSYQEINKSLDYIKGLSLDFKSPKIENKGGDISISISGLDNKMKQEENKLIQEQIDNIKKEILILKKNSNNLYGEVDKLLSNNKRSITKNEEDFKEIDQKLKKINKNIEDNEDSIYNEIVKIEKKLWKKIEEINDKIIQINTNIRSIKTNHRIDYYIQMSGKKKKIEKQQESPINTPIKSNIFLINNKRNDSQEENSNNKNINNNLKLNLNKIHKSNQILNNYGCSKENCNYCKGIEENLNDLIIQMQQNQKKIKENKQDLENLASELAESVETIYENINILKNDIYNESNHKDDYKGENINKKVNPEYDYKEIEKKMDVYENNMVQMKWDLNDNKKKLDELINKNNYFLENKEAEKIIKNNNYLNNNNFIFNKNIYKNSYELEKDIKRNYKNNNVRILKEIYNKEIMKLIDNENIVKELYSNLEFGNRINGIYIGEKCKNIKIKFNKQKGEYKKYIFEYIEDLIDFNGDYKINKKEKLNFNFDNNTGQIYINLKKRIIGQVCSICLRKGHDIKLCPNIVNIYKLINLHWNKNKLKKIICPICAIPHNILDAKFLFKCKLFKRMFALANINNYDLYGNLDLNIEQFRENYKEIKQNLEILLLNFINIIEKINNFQNNIIDKSIIYENIWIKDKVLIQKAMQTIKKIDNKQKFKLFNLKNSREAIQYVIMIYKNIKWLGKGNFKKNFWIEEKGIKYNIDENLMKDLYWNIINLCVTDLIDYKVTNDLEIKIEININEGIVLNLYNKYLINNKQSIEDIRNKKDFYKMLYDLYSDRINETNINVKNKKIVKNQLIKLKKKNEVLKNDKEPIEIKIEENFNYNNLNVDISSDSDETVSGNMNNNNYEEINIKNNIEKKQIDLNQFNIDNKILIDDKKLSNNNKRIYNSENINNIFKNLRNNKKIIKKEPRVDKKIPLYESLKDIKMDDNKKDNKQDNELINISIDNNNKTEVKKINNMDNKINSDIEREQENSLNEIDKNLNDNEDLNANEE